MRASNSDTCGVPRSTRGRPCISPRPVTIAVFSVLVGRQRSFCCVGVPHYHWYHAPCLRIPIYLYLSGQITSQRGRHILTMWQILAGPNPSLPRFPDSLNIRVSSSDCAPWELLASQASPSFGLRRGEDVSWRLVSQPKIWLSIWQIWNINF